MDQIQNKLSLGANVKETDQFYGKSVGFLSGMELDDALHSMSTKEIHNVKRNCHTDRPTMPDKYCGDCDIHSNPPLLQCHGVPSNPLITTRNKPVDFLIQPRDSFDTTTSLESGVTVEISLCQGTSKCTATEAAAYGGTVVTANDLGDGTLTATLQSTKPGPW
jgi:hypothetical protein